MTDKPPYQMFIHAWPTADNLSFMHWGIHLTHFGKHTFESQLICEWKENGNEEWGIREGEDAASRLLLCPRTMAKWANTIRPQCKLIL